MEDDDGIPPGWDARGQEWDGFEFYNGKQITTSDGRTGMFKGIAQGDPPIIRFGAPGSDDFVRADEIVAVDPPGGTPPPPKKAPKRAPKVVDELAKKRKATKLADEGLYGGEHAELMRQMGLEPGAEVHLEQAGKGFAANVRAKLTPAQLEAHLEQFGKAAQLNRKQISAVVSLMGDDPMGRMAKVVWRLGYSAGLRTGEIAKMQLWQIVPRAEGWAIRAGTRKTQITPEADTIPIPEHVADALLAYVSDNNVAVREMLESGMAFEDVLADPEAQKLYVFEKPGTGEPLGPSGTQWINDKLIKPYAFEAKRRFSDLFKGIPKTRLTSYLLRRSAAGEIYRTHKDLLLVGRILRNDEGVAAGYAQYPLDEDLWKLMGALPSWEESTFNVVHPEPFVQAAPTSNAVAAPSATHAALGEREGAIDAWMKARKTAFRALSANLGADKQKLRFGQTPEAGWVERAATVLSSKGFEPDEIYPLIEEWAVQEGVLGKDPKGYPDRPAVAKALNAGSMGANRPVELPGYGSFTVDEQAAFSGETFTAREPMSVIEKRAAASERPGTPGGLRSTLEALGVTDETLEQAQQFDSLAEERAALALKKRQIDVALDKRMPAPGDTSPEAVQLREFLEGARRQSYQVHGIPETAQDAVVAEQLAGAAAPEPAPMQVKAGGSVKLKGPFRGRLYQGKDVTGGLWEISQVFDGSDGPVAELTRRVGTGKKAQTLSLRLPVSDLTPDAADYNPPWQEFFTPEEMAELERQDAIRNLFRDRAEGMQRALPRRGSRWGYPVDMPFRLLFEDGRSPLTVDFTRGDASIPQHHVDQLFESGKVVGFVPEDDWVKLQAGDPEMKRKYPRAGQYAGRARTQQGPWAGATGDPFEDFFRPGGNGAPPPPGAPPPGAVPPPDDWGTNVPPPEPEKGPSALVPYGEGPAMPPLATTSPWQLIQHQGSPSQTLRLRPASLEGTTALSAGFGAINASSERLQSGYWRSFFKGLTPAQIKAESAKAEAYLSNVRERLIRMDPTPDDVHSVKLAKEKILKGKFSGYRTSSMADIAQAQPGLADEIIKEAARAPIHQMKFDKVRRAALGAMGAGGSAAGVRTAVRGLSRWAYPIVIAAETFKFLKSYKDASDIDEGEAERLRQFKDSELSAEDRHNLYAYEKLEVEDADWMNALDHLTNLVAPDMIGFRRKVGEAGGEFKFSWKGLVSDVVALGGGLLGARWGLKGLAKAGKGGPAKVLAGGLGLGAAGKIGTSAFLGAGTDPDTKAKAESAKKKLADYDAIKQKQRMSEWMGKFMQPQVQSMVDSAAMSDYYANRPKPGVPEGPRFQGRSQAQLAMTLGAAMLAAPGVWPVSFDPSVAAGINVPQFTPMGELVRAPKEAAAPSISPEFFKK